MVDRVEVEIIKDSSGFPTQINVKRGARKLTATYENGQKLKVSGDIDLSGILGLIYPFPQQATVNIPQPLQVTNVQGGKTILFDDMEGLLKWSAGAVDNTYAFGGSNSLKVACGAGAATVTRYFAMPPSQKVSWELLFSTDAWANFAANSLLFTLFHDDGLTVAQASVLYDRTTRTWYFYDDVGGSRTFTIPAPLAVKAGVQGAWHRFKISADLLNHFWIKAEIDNHAVDMTGLKCETAATSGTIQSAISVQGTSAGVGANFWLDNVSVTEE